MFETDGFCREHSAECSKLMASAGSIQLNVEIFDATILTFSRMFETDGSFRQHSAESLDLMATDSIFQANVQIFESWFQAFS
jgi:hypothetical protein